jgi:hypothetical protein
MVQNGGQSKYQAPKIISFDKIYFEKGYENSAETVRNNFLEQICW